MILNSATRSPIRFWTVLGKLCLAILVAALLVSLARVRLGSEKRFAEMQELYRSGRLVAGNATDANDFQALVVRCVGITNIKERIVINSPPVQGRLHFYLTSQENSSFTRCLPGNAVYDSELDTVFVDYNLFRPTELPRIGQALMWESAAPTTFPFSRTFLTLILLHELGHRELHRFQASAFDGTWSSRARAREAEADDFAIRTLEHAYTSGTITPDPDVKAELDEAGLKTGLSPTEQFAISMLYANSQMSIGLLFSKGSFSSLYEDESHPSYGQRVEHIASSVSAIYQSDRSVVPYANYFESISKRIDGLRSEGLIEIDCDAPIAATSFDEDGLILIDRSWHIWRVPVEQFEGGHAGEKSLRLRPRSIGAIPTIDSNSRVEQVWRFRGRGTFLRVGDDVFQIHRDSIIRRQELAQQMVHARSAFVVPGLVPCGKVVFRCDDGIDVLSDDGHPYSIPWSSVRRDCGVPNNSDIGGFDDVQLFGDEVCASVRRGGDLIGALRLSITAPYSRRFIPLRSSPGADPNGKLIMLTVLGSTHYFLCGKSDLWSPVSVWELVEDGPPRLCTSYSPLLTALSGEPESGQNVPVIVRDARVVNGARGYITLAADSILAFEGESKTLRPIFYPGTSVHMTFGPKGEVEFSAYNGYKSFVLLPR